MVFDARRGVRVYSRPPSSGSLRSPPPCAQSARSTGSVTRKEIVRARRRRAFFRLWADHFLREIEFMRDRANEVRIRINDGITVPQVRLID